MKQNEIKDEGNMADMDIESNKFNENSSMTSSSAIDNSSSSEV